MVCTDETKAISRASLILFNLYHLLYEEKSILIIIIIIINERDNGVYTMKQKQSAGPPSGNAFVIHAIVTYKQIYIQIYTSTIQIQIQTQVQIQKQKQSTGPHHIQGSGFIIFMFRKCFCDGGNSSGSTLAVSGKLSHSEVSSSFLFIHPYDHCKNEYDHKNSKHLLHHKCQFESWS